MDNKNKTEIIKFRLTKSEKQKIQRIAEENECSVSEYVLNQSLGEKAIYRHREIIQILNNIHSRDVKVDTNINQIAKVLNTNYKNLDRDMLLDFHDLMLEYLKMKDKQTKEVKRMIKVLSS